MKRHRLPSAIALALVSTAWVSGLAPAVVEAQVPYIRDDTPQYSFVLHDEDAWTTPFKNQASDGPELEYYLFAPVRPDGKKLSEAPVVVLFHGWEISPDPVQDRAQILHYVRSGYTVIWPRYCSPGAFCSDFAQFQSQAHSAVLTAMWHLQIEGGDPDSDLPKMTFGDGRFSVHYVSHSLGSYAAALLADHLGELGFTTAPKSLVFVDPAGHDFAGGTLPLSAEDLSHVRDDTLLLILAAAETEGQPNAFETARRLYHHIPAAKKWAWVVQHQCAQSSTGGWDFDACPADLSGSSTGRTHRYYYSGHNSMKSSTSVDAMVQVGFFNHATACLKEAETGATQVLCGTPWAAWAGYWLVPGGTGQFAALKQPYTLPAP